MRARLVLSLLATLGFAFSILAPGLGAQNRGETSSPGAAGRWTAPRTAWGHPDIQGIWDSTTGTPLERPSDLADKEFLTDEEAAAREKRRWWHSSDRPDRGPGNPTGDYGSVWRRGLEDAAVNRTSLVVEPKSGKLPPLTAEATCGARCPTSIPPRQAGSGRLGRGRTAALWERCITRGTPRIPNNYNSNWHILQTSDHIVIHQEMIHENRLISLDSRPHLSGADSTLERRLARPVGRRHAGGRNDELQREAGVQGRSPHSHRLIERFTRTAAATLDYTFHDRRQDDLRGAVHDRAADDDEQRAVRTSTRRHRATTGSRTSCRGTAPKKRRVTGSIGTF